MQPYYNRISYGNKFGFAEMYEWANFPDTNINVLGKLVQFSKEFPDKIEIAKNTHNIIGITSITSGFQASNPDDWPYKYIFNEFEDLYLKKEDIAISNKEYDPIMEFSYLSTKKQQIYVPIENEYYDESKQYIKRSYRKEWASVILLGKAIVEDDGNCKEGEYCTLYQGEDNSKFGTVIPATDIDSFKLLVLQRLSEKSILVFMAPQIYNPQL